MAYLARDKSMNRRFATGTLLLVGLALAGCSTVKGDWSQRISIEATDAQNRPVDGIACIVGEGSAAQTVTTPAHDVKVRRSAMPLQISCGSDGQLAAATVKPRRERMEEALLPFGSVGVFVDHLSGALYAYPTALRLRLGQHVVLEHGGESQVASSDPLPASPTAATAPAGAARTELAAVQTYPIPRRPVSPTPVLAPAKTRAAASPTQSASAAHPAKPAALATPVKPVAPAQKIALSTPTVAATTGGAAALASAPVVHTAPVNW
jgi:hypothetical protein